jgi:hypothetical protein
LNLGDITLQSLDRISEADESDEESRTGRSRSVTNHSSGGFSPGAADGGGAAGSAGVDHRGQPSKVSRQETVGERLVRSTSSEIQAFFDGQRKCALRVVMCSNVCLIATVFLVVVYFGMGVGRPKPTAGHQTQTGNGNQ